MARTDQTSSSTGSNTGSTNSQSAYEGNNSRTVDAREKLSDLSETAGRQIDNSPLIAVGAGVALGAILGAVLPKTQKEQELLGPLGTKLTDAGYSAADRAREMSKQKFDEMAGDKVREFFGGSGSSSSGNANS
ncbi:hypothetical protein ACFQPG_10710 [Sphingomonas sp. GCM10030256]|uniref:hypothetical protein n=1 Tax=Sphingomonas sp. GCM10030256 TaxID=3273427 RepID=UPI0036094FF3